MAARILKGAPASKTGSKRHSTKGQSDVLRARLKLVDDGVHAALGDIDEALARFDAVHTLALEC